MQIRYNLLNCLLVIMALLFEEKIFLIYLSFILFAVEFELSSTQVFS